MSDSGALQAAQAAQANVNRIPAQRHAIAKAARPNRAPIIMPERQQMVVVQAAAPPVEPPRQLGSVAAPRPECWKVTQADLLDFEKLFLPLLVERFKGASSDSLFSWACVMAREPGPTALFVRSEWGLALFRVEKSPWMPRGLVEEQWTVTARSHLDSLDILYREATKWGIALGAALVRFHPTKNIDPIAKGFSAEEAADCYEIVLP